MTLDIVTEVEAISRAFVDSLDTSVLGDLAVDVEGLYLCDVGHRLELSLRREGVSTADKPIEYATASNETQWALTDHHKKTLVSLFDYHAEVLFWWHSSGDAEMIGYVEYGSGTVGTAVRKLYLAAYPESMHSYFYSGMFDIPFIEKCIANDIDAQLALSAANAR